MNGHTFNTNHTFYPIYRNNATGELWDPRTGDVLYPHTTSAAWGRFKRTVRRYLVWTAVLLTASAPAWLGR